MKTLTLSFEECVRILIIFRGHRGTRKDTKTRTLLGVAERIGISAADVDKYAKQVAGNGFVLDLEGLRKVEESKSIDVTKEEARIMLGLLDALEVTVEDLATWVDSLATRLEAACA